MPSKAQTVEAYVARRLRGLRLQLGVSQSQIAKHVGVTFQQIQKYEAGINRISAGRLFQLAELYGVPIAEFFPKSAATREGRRKSALLDDLAVFAASPLGQELYEGFLRISDSRKRRTIIALVHQMADQ